MFTPSPLPRKFEAAVRDVTSTRPEVRASSVADLARHVLADASHRTRALTLLEAALEDKDARVRAAAAVALGDVSATEALPVLLVAVEDSDAYVRQMAINALGEIGDRRASPRLFRALKDERPEVRYQSLIAYTRLEKDQRSDIATALTNAVNDEDESIQYIALRIAEERCVFRDARLDAAMVSKLSHPSESIALAAALTLARSGHEGGKAYVAGVVREQIKAKEREDEQAAVEAAGELGMKELVPDLERRAWGLGRIVRDTCAWHAKIALATLGHERATAEFVKDLGSLRRQTREAAMVAAGRARIEAARAIIEGFSASDVDAGLRAEALACIDGKNSPERAGAYR